MPLSPNRWRTLSPGLTVRAEALCSHTGRAHDASQHGYQESKEYGYYIDNRRPLGRILTIAADDLVADVREHLEPRYDLVAAPHVVAGVARAEQQPPHLILLQEHADEVALSTLASSLVTYDQPIALLTTTSLQRSGARPPLERLTTTIALPLDGVTFRSRVAALIQLYQHRRALWQATHGKNHDDLSGLKISDIALLGKTQRLIERQFADPLFSTTDLADALQLSDRQLRRKLGTLLQQKPNTLIRRFRLAHGAALLQEGRLPIRAVAIRAGFSSHARFSVAFRERYGVTPSAYAATHKNFTLPTPAMSESLKPMSENEKHVP